MCIFFCINVYNKYNKSSLSDLTRSRGLNRHISLNSVAHVVKLQ